MYNFIMSKLLKCGKCGWVHFQVSRQKAEEEVNRFNSYFDTLSEDDQKSHYGGEKSSIDSYEHCFRCRASHELAVEAQEGDAPLGSTIQPMIDPMDFKPVKTK
jgi:hypothetical protein